MKNGVLIRKATSKDYDSLSAVMFDAVRNGPSKYNEQQRRAWVSERRSGASWAARLDGQAIMIAIRAEEHVGFMSLASDGYIDFAYVRPASQGSGVFSKLYEAIEILAIEKGEPRLWVHASLMAQPAFGAKGFAIRRRESIEISGQQLDRFEMEKILNHGTLRPAQ